MQRSVLCLAILFGLSACRDGKPNEAGDPAGGDPGSGTGDAATGDPAPGDAATGDPVPGDAATGDPAPGDAAPGDPGAGDEGVCPDEDDDGICDSSDTCVDVDDDGLGNGHNGNTTCDALATDTNDADPDVCGDTDMDSCDDCALDGIWNPSTDDADADGTCDVGDTCVDVDGDGLGIGHSGNVTCEALATDTNDADPHVCGDTDVDGCDDCALGGTWDTDSDDRDNDGTCDIVDTCMDMDGDGLGDGTSGNSDCGHSSTDTNDGDASICGDTDADGCEDCALAGVWAPGGDGPDQDGDGLCDSGDPDGDGDGIDEDGDGSGTPGDNTCLGGATFDCDDNCPLDANPLQEDTDSDGIGDACEPPTCDDGIENQGEQGIDCGGPCIPCGSHGTPCTGGGDCFSGDCDVGGTDACVGPWHVDPLGAHTSGLTWADAFNDVQSGIDAASVAGGGQVWVAAGTYVPLPMARTSSFVLATNVEVIGGFAGSESAPITCDHDTNPTVLDGNVHGTYGTPSDDALHVVSAVGISDARLDCFLVRNGWANLIDNDSGGGVLVSDSPRITLANLDIQLCRAFHVGGGVAVLADSDSLELSGSYIGYNTASHGGGGLAIEDSWDVVVTGTEFSQNMISAASGRGGGVRARDAQDLVFSDVRFVGNSSLDDGGAVYARYSDGVWFERCVFSSNFTENNGGAISLEDSIGYLASSLLHSNVAVMAGGAILSDSSDFTIVNATITANSANDGGGLLNANGTTSVFNSILYFNVPDEIVDGGGVSLSYSDVQLNCASRTEPTECEQAGCDWEPLGMTCTMPVGSMSIDSDPAFTVDYGLVLGLSPCIDVAAQSSCEELDLDGNGRVDHTGIGNDDSDFCDMGAYEAQ